MRKRISQLFLTAAVAAALAECPSAAHGQVVTYSAVDFYATFNDLPVTPIALNASDQVVGYLLGEYPFVYSKSTGFNIIPGVGPNGNSEATGINNAGLIVGNDGTNGRGFVYSAGASTSTEVAPVAGGTLTFSGINNNGIAVGTTSTAGGGNTLITYNVTSGVRTDVGSGFTGSPSNSYGTAINDNNTVLGLGLQSSPTNSYPAHFQPFTASPAAGGGYSYTNVGNAVEAVIPESGAYPIPGYYAAQGLSLNGDVAGTTYATNVGTYKPQFYNDAGGYVYNGSTGAVTDIGYTNQVTAVADVNGVAETVGTYYASVTSGGNSGSTHRFDAFTYTSSGGLIDISNSIPNYVLSNVVAINSNGDLLATGYLNGDSTLRYLLLTANVVPSVTYTGAVSNVWNTTTANFTPANYANGDYVTFDDTATGSTTVNIPSPVTPASVSFNNSSKSYVLTGASIGGASTKLTLNGSGSVTLNNSNTFAGPVAINAGSLTIGSTGSLASNNITLYRNTSLTVQNGGALTSAALNLSISTGCSFTIAPTTPDKVVLQLTSLVVGGYQTQLDVANTDMILHKAVAATPTYYIAEGYANGTWLGNGIVSSAAKNDSTHLTTLGTIQNSQDGTPTGPALYSTFDGVPVVDTDVLVKYTYCGDANLDGHVDASDYSLIDNAFTENQSNFYPLTGWYNGDFNYDGVIDGSDYALIDNSFNTQGASFSGSFPAFDTAQIANIGGTSAVPEPVATGLLSVVLLGLHKRRPRQV